MAINKVILVGNIGQDPELKTVGETNVINFTLATTEKGYTTKAGKVVEEKTEWHNIVAWGHTANYINVCSKKGDKVYVGGKLRYESYEADGVKKFVTKIVCDEFEPFNKKVGDVPF